MQPDIFQTWVVCILQTLRDLKLEKLKRVGCSMSSAQLMQS
jgi:hypothetical protein